VHAAPSQSLDHRSPSESVNIATLRYDERIGVVPVSPRSPGGHRPYDAAQTAGRISLDDLVELGVSIDEVRCVGRDLQPAT
jgi:DNA-binding transcriptional MerR regulator